MPASVVLHCFGDREKPVVLLLHGIGAGHRLWLRQIEHFKATHFVVAPDLPGMTAPPAANRVDLVEIANALARELKGQGIDRLSVCGISAGASVALALAMQMGESIRHLILSAPQARAPRLALGLQITISQAMPEQSLLAMAARLCQSDPEIAAAAVEDCRSLGKQGFLEGLRGLWRLDLRDNLSAITVPTFVFCGARDFVNIPAARAIASAIPGAMLRIEPDAGHLWNIDHPVQFNDALASVLAIES